MKNLLIELNMNGALSALESINSIEGKKEFVIALLQAEIDYRQRQASARRLTNAAFPVEKEWSDIDPALNPEIDFKRVQELCTGEFLQKKQNLCIIGQQGTGKSLSLVALGRQLCRKGYSVKFYTASELVRALEEAKDQKCLSKIMKAILKPSLLVIDELGFVPFTETGARLLFDVFSSRYERGSIAISSNLTFDKWTEIFGSLELTGALIDRLIHNAHICVYKGDSIRLKQSKQNLLKFEVSQ